MKAYEIRITPLTAFATELKGDTFFGQFCWAIRTCFGNELLEEFLEGYQNRPKLVFSDAFPDKHLPKPSLPDFFGLQSRDDSSQIDRKELKRRKWISLEKLKKQEQFRLINNWFDLRLFSDIPFPRFSEQWRNRIDRSTGTTGGNNFAPFSEKRFWYFNDAEKEYAKHDTDQQRQPVIYALLDTENKILSEEMFRESLQMMGETGYGAGKSYGLGKFTCRTEPTDLFKTFESQENNAFLTLANCNPFHGESIDPEQSFYETHTVIGRHGEQDVFRMSPFKKPLMLTKAGAVLSFKTSLLPRLYAGSSDFTNLSRPHSKNKQYQTIKTVHQGYAPVLPVKLEMPQYF